MEDLDIVTPWNVSSVSKDGIDYKKLITKFGCDPIDGNLIKRFEKVTNVKAHTWLRRGLFFSNKDFSKILDEYEKGNPIYIYTGRGPSSESIHLGHLIPFIFTKYLQDVFGAVVIIQMSDDEKFVFKGDSQKKSIEYYNALTYSNAKAIIACGFNPHKTYIFSNYRKFGGGLYSNTIKINQSTTGNQIRGIYGLTLNNNVGELMWPAMQCAPAFSNSFVEIFHKKGPFTKENFDGSKDYTEKHIYCLIPMAIDQDPYFRMARDFAEKYKKNGYLKPATIHTKFLIGLKGIKEKMSSSGDSPVLYLTDDEKILRNKINKYAFSGGGDTKENHIKYGGNLHIDVSYQYLLYFMDDDVELSKIANDYKLGKLMSSELKLLMANVVCDVISNHQKTMTEITDDFIKLFFSCERDFDMSLPIHDKIELESDDVYASYGINFDTTFGSYN